MRQSSLTFGIESKDIEHAIPKYVNNRKIKISQLDLEIRKIDETLVTLRTQIREAEEKHRQIQNHNQLLEILNDITNIQGEKNEPMHVYLIEQELLRFTLLHKQRLALLGFHLETENLKFGWYMEQLHGSSEWSPWFYEIEFSDEIGLRYKKKNLSADENVSTHSDYLNLTVEDGKEYGFDDMVDTGKRRICLFIKEEIGLIVKKRDWSTVCTARPKGNEQDDV